MKKKKKKKKYEKKTGKSHDRDSKPISWLLMDDSCEKKYNNHDTTFMLKFVHNINLSKAKHKHSHNKKKNNNKNNSKSNSYNE